MGSVLRILALVSVLLLGCGRSGYDSTSAPDAGAAPSSCEVFAEPLIDLFVDGDYSCAQRQDRSIWCWGANDSGQLGDGTFESRHQPAAVAITGGISLFGTGQRHACAQDDAGIVRCWGRNQRGQLGIGNLSPAPSPSQINGAPPTLAEMRAGSAQTLVVSSTGELRMAGHFNGVSNGVYETSFVDVALPGPVRTASGASAPRPSTDGHTCATLEDGRVYCWGTNVSGQLGDGTTDNSPTPVEVLGIDSAIDVVSGNDHSCALLDDGTVRCWGEGSDLGANSSGPISSPVAPDLTETAVQLDADNDTTCAVTAEREVWCWGGLPAPARSPTRIDGLLDISKVEVGEEHACALDTAGVVRCWGLDHSGQLGRNQQPWSSQATVSGTGASLLGTSHGDSSCAVLSGELRCWGRNDRGQLVPGAAEALSEPTPTSVGNAVAIATGRNHTCVALVDGTVTCFGDNAQRRLGVDDLGATGPVQATGLADIIDVAVGAGHSCAVSSSGEVFCWGDNNEGKTLSPDEELPTLLTEITAPAAQVVAGASHTCVRLEDGSAVCFGRNNEGQIGNESEMGDAVQPTPVDDLTTIVELAAGLFFTCARLAGGTVWCWGYNDYGQLGLDSTNERVRSPAQVLGLTSAVQLTAGGQHACALDSEGTVWCWGDGSRGQLGDGSTVRANQPVRATELDGAIEVRAGLAHTCARMGDGTLRCVGGRSSGQLGDGAPAIPRTVGVAAISCERFR